MIALQKPAKLKVRMISHRLPPEYSGAGEQCYRLAEEMSLQGIDAGILTFTMNPRLAGDSEMGGIRVRRILLGRRSHIADVMSRLAGEVRFVFEEDKADVIQWHGFLKDIVTALPLKRLSGAKWIMVNSLVGYDDFETIRGYGSVYARAVSCLDAVVSISPALNETYGKCPGFNGKLRVIPQGVNTARFSPVGPLEKMRLRARLGLPRDRKLLCFAGAVVRRKGVHHLLGLMSRLREMPLPPVLIIAGPWEGDMEELGGGYKRELDEYARQTGIDNLLFWAGHVDNVENYMQASDIFLFASQREGFANVIAEAMSCGLPCVAGRIPGVTDFIVEDNVTGFVVNAEDREVFSKVVRRLIDDEPLRVKMGQEARERSNKLFSVNNKVREYIRLYNQLLGVHENGHS